MIEPEPLGREAFASFGDAIDVSHPNRFEINDGFTKVLELQLCDRESNEETAPRPTSYPLTRRAQRTEPRRTAAS